MNCATVTTGLVNCEKRLYSASKDDYKLDIWKELKKRWMIFGVLISMALAVLAPKVGAPGGPLHTEYLSYPPLWCIYYMAGRRSHGRGAGARCAALGAAHAHAAQPALLALTASVLSGAVDWRLLKGALLCSVGGPCGWLSLVVAHDVGAALTMLAVSYAASLVAAPISLFLICGRAPIPALGPSLWSALCVLPPLTAGAAHARLYPAPRPPRHALERVATLALLYVDCCERTATAGAPMYLGDVLATLLLAWWSVFVSALACAAYARAGLTPAARTLALCAVPKALHAGWESSTDCVAGGLSRLPGVFLAPAQALLLAAVARTDEDPELPH